MGKSPRFLDFHDFAGGAICGSDVLRIIGGAKASGLPSRPPSGPAAAADLLTAFTGRIEARYIPSR